MDPVINPYAPGAGTKPPELAGRDEIISASTIAIRRVCAGRHAQSILLLGLRGVGKTVLLNTIEGIAAAERAVTVSFEAYENRDLASQLIPRLQKALYMLDRWERGKKQIRSAFRSLAEFASIFSVSFGGVEVGAELNAIRRFSGNLEIDLPDLMAEIGLAAREASTPVVLFIDEVQFLTANDLGALIVALHRVSQMGYPVFMVGAGLPQLSGLAGDAKSYAERLFDYPEVGPLDQMHATQAICEPALREGVMFSQEAIDEILTQTRGYPYFLQEWGKHAWNEAHCSPISVVDARNATKSALHHLDTGFFKVRLDRLTPREKSYLRAMAGLGPGPHRSGEIANRLGGKVQSFAPIRSLLINKGMIYSPNHGNTAFTVPLFDEYMRRTVPDSGR